MHNRIIIATIASVFCSGLIIFGLTNIVIDPYIKATNWGANLFDFYEKNNETNKIYFIGDSLTVCGVDPVIIQNSLMSNNLSFNVYSLAYLGDLPLSRIIELASIAESKPKIVVIGFSYNWLGSYEYFPPGEYPEKRFLMGSDKIVLDSYTRSLFNKTELGRVKIDPLQLIAYKRRFIIPGIQLMLSDIGLSKVEQVKNWCDEFGCNQFDFKNQIMPIKKIVEPFKSPCYYNLSEDDNRNRKAFRYIISYLKERGIHVILVNLPICPYVESCKENKNDSRVLRDFLDKTGCPFYDLESLCSAGEFRDNLHVNYKGRMNVSRKMADILLKEERKFSIEFNYDIKS
jgi:hypothetical protein